MEVERKNTSYLIFFQRGKDIQRTSVVGVSEETDLVKLIRTTFKGRFDRPAALLPKDGVNIKIKRLDHINHQISLILNVKVYNKSPRQTRIDVEKAIRTTN